MTINSLLHNAEQSLISDHVSVKSVLLVTGFTIRPIVTLSHITEARMSVDKRSQYRAVYCAFFCSYG